MTRSVVLSGLMICLMMGLPGCGDEPAVAEPEPVARMEREPGPFDAQVQEIAATYRQFERVSEHASLAMLACAAPTPARGVLQSTSNDTDTHGRKLYFLYAKHASSYRQIGDPFFRSPEVASWVESTAVGQVIVKESFVPVKVAVNQKPSPLHGDPKGLTYPAEYIRNPDGTFYKTGEPAGLFIMFKLDPETPGTDEGWVYAATSPDGMLVLDAGRMESCMNCHKRAANDRLFGL